MNGLEVVELRRPGLFQRLLGWRVKENAYLEIQNQLASTPIKQLPESVVIETLESYRIPLAAAKPRLKKLYETVFRHFLSDAEISDAELEDLRRLRTLFGLTDQDITEIEKASVHPIYEKAVQHALRDRRVSSEEKQNLENLAKKLRLPDEVAKAIRSKNYQALLQQAYDEALRDRRLSPAEEEELKALAENLGASAALDSGSQAALAHFRLLWRMEQGELPDVPVSIHLKRGEVCHASAAASHHEYRTVTKAIRYAGPMARVRIMKGLYYRVGQVSFDRVTQDYLKLLDVGTLYLTNKRLFFDGGQKNTSIPLSNVIDFTMFSDGIQIQKDSGKDQFFQCPFGDSLVVERWGVMLQAALTNDRG